jgi:alpha-beta hydrolase superfamily lysophospholipase
MPFFDGAEGRVYYRSWPAATPRAGVVFLHGYGEHSGFYHRFAAALNHRDVSLWALDEIGHGLTDGARGVVRSLDALEANARRLAALAATESPDLPLVLAGHSLGAAAAALAITRDPAPFAGAVLSGAPLAPVSWFDASAADNGLALELADLSADPGYLDQLENDPLGFIESEGPPLSALPAAWAELSTTFTTVSVPVLLVHGERDVVAPVADSRDWAARIERVQLFEVPDGRHDILNDTTHARVAEAIAAFVLATAADPAR